EEWTHRLDEERKAFLEDRRLWADNLAQLQADMHKLWQNELQQFQRTLETIQGQLERSARDAAAANKFQQTQEVSSEPDHGTADVLRMLWHMNSWKKPLCMKYRSLPIQQTNP